MAKIRQKSIRIDQICKVTLFAFITAIVHETEFRFRFAGSDSHAFNFGSLFTMLDFRLNITITFCLDQYGARLSEL